MDQNASFVKEKRDEEARSSFQVLLSSYTLETFNIKVMKCYKLEHTVTNQSIWSSSVYHHTV
jgi:hypothetical protein